MIKQVFQIYNERGDFFIQLTLEHLKISGSAILLGAIIEILCSNSYKINRLIMMIFWAFPCG